MGQTPNVVNTYDDMQDDPRFDRTPVMVTDESTGMTATTPTDSDDPAAIEADIEATRADMSQTINEIQERLNPDNLKAQAKEVMHDATVGRAQEAVSNVSDRAQQFVGNNSVVETIRQNPIPAALAGVGIGWLWMHRSKNWHSEPYYYQPGRHTTMREQRYYSPGFQRYEQREQRYMEGQQHDSGSRFSGVSDTASNAFGAVQDTAGSAMGNVTDAAGSAMDTVQETAGQFAGQVGQWGSQAQDQMQDLRYRTDRMLNENPLPLGLVALGLGMAVGLLLPETEKERELMGEQRDQLMDRAQTAGQQVVEKVQQVAEDATNTVQQSAQEQGLTTQ